MTIEVESIPMENEVDWALKYAEEARIRAKMEVRLDAILVCVGTLYQAMDDFIDTALTMNGEVTTEVVVKKFGHMMGELHDCRAMVDYNLFDSPRTDMDEDTRLAMTLPEEDRTPTQTQKVDHYLESLSVRSRDAWKQCIKEWATMCDRHNLVGPVETKENARQEFLKKVSRALAHVALAQKQKENEHGKTQNAEVH